MEILFSLYVKIEKLKVFFSEWIAIYKKRKIYKLNKWNKEKQKEFDSFWLEVYGHTISNRWHRLYEVMSGKYDVKYIPEIIYSTQLAFAGNDYHYSLVLSDKNLVEGICKDSGCVVPKTICGCSNGIYFDSERKPIAQEQIFQILNDNENIVIKPAVGSSSGKGIIFLTAEKKLLQTELKNKIMELGRDFICQKIVSQHETFAKLNAESLNTLRVMTYSCSDGIYHLPIALRIGRKHGKVDNIHAGGLCVGVGDDGVLQKEAFELAYGNICKKYTHHPDSNIEFDGYQIANVGNVIECAHELHKRFPRIKFISWDFGVDVFGKVVLIEINLKGQSIWFPQIVNGRGAFGDNTKKIFDECLLK